MKLRLRFNALIQREKFLWENASYDDAWFAIILLSGSFEVTMRGRRDEVNRGDVVIFPQGEPFRRRAHRPLSMIYIGFEPLGEIDSRFCGRLDFLERERVAEDTRMLRSLAELPRLVQLERAEHYFEDIVFEFSRARPESCIIDPGQLADKLVSSAVRHIGRDFSRPMRVSELAEEAGLSHVSFTNRFVRAVGMTPIEYLRRTRLTEAARLLNSTELTVREISERCGFENQFYFSRSFSAMYGLSPSEWRRQGRL